MTLSTTTNRVDAPGNGSATTFSFAPVVIFEASDLQVTVRDSSGNETALVEGSGTANYSVTVSSYPGIGSITYPATGGSPLPSGSTITIKRIVPLLQAVSLVNQGAYFPKIQEGEFDYLTAIDQQQQEQINRTVQLPATDPSVPILLPSSAARANQLLGFDGSGNPIAAQPGSAIISTAMQPFAASASTLAATALLRFQNAAAGSVARSITAKMFELGVSVLDFGAIGDGTTDDTAAFVTALNSRGSAVSVKGGVVDVPAGYNFKVNSFTVPSGVTLRGPYMAGMGAPGLSNFSPPYNAQSWLRVTGANSIILAGGAAISGCIVAPFGMTFQQTTSAGFSGTAITINGDDATVEKCMIFGFANGVLSSGFQRVRVRDCNMDNLNCVAITGSLDVCHITSVHCWPFATISQAGTDTLRRSGIAFNFSGCLDDTRVNSCFSFGYNVGFNVNNSGGLTFTACAADDTQAGFNTGFAIIGSSNIITLVGCLASAHVNGYFISATGAGNINTLIGCSSFGNTTNGVLVDAAATADVVIIGMRVQDCPQGISVATAVPWVDIDARFNNIADPTRCIFATVVTNRIIIRPTCTFGTTAAGTSVAGNGNLTVPALASAATVLLPTGSDVLLVTGTTSFAALSGGWAGRKVTLVFGGVLTVTSTFSGATANMRLAGGSNFVTALGSTLTLQHTGVQWFEVSRAA